MSREIIEDSNRVDGQTGWESVAEMAEGGASKGMESLAGEPNFGEHIVEKGGEYEGLMEDELKFVKWIDGKLDAFNECMNDSDYEGQESISGELIEQISEGATDYWDNQVFVEKIVNSFKEHCDCKPHFLLSLGMPAKVILSDPEYYDEMVNDEDFSQYFWHGHLYDFYQVMSSTEEGKERFRRDFVESGAASSISKQSIDAIAEGEELCEDAIADLETIKASGSNLFEGVSLERHIPSDEKLRDMDVNDRKIGKIIAEGLYKYNLLGGEEIAEIYSRELKGERYFVGVGILDVAVENRIAAKSENSDINYWSQLTLDSGHNMVGEFVMPFDGSLSVPSVALKRQKEFDFSQEPVMRLFANYFSRKEDHGLAVEWYNDPKFVEALKQPISQEIIMEAIEERNKTDPYIHCPSLLLMLARDRDALQNMQERGLFERYEGCRDIPVLGEIIEKLEKGDLNDRDIVLMYGNSYLSRQDDCFDEDGNLNVEGAQRYLRAGLPGEAVKIDPSVYRKLFDGWERIGLSKQNPKVLAEAGFSREEILLLIAYKHSYNTALRLNDIFGLKDIQGYFDNDNSPNSNFVDKMFMDDFGGLVDRPDLLPLVSSPAKQQFIKFYSQNTTSHEFLASMDKDLVEELFDVSGPKPDFWLYVFKEFNFDFILSQDEENFSRMPFDEKQKKIINMYKKLPDLELFKDLLTVGYEDLTINQLDKLGDLLGSLSVSNADEIAKNPASFAKNILGGYTTGDEDELTDRFRKIEEIYVHNNLPFVGKVFNTFSVVFMNEAWKRMHPGVMDRGDLKGVPEEQKRRILWNDLLKASVGSGNKQLREYLESLQEGSVLAEKLLSEDVLKNEFTDDEIGVLNEYAEHLDTLYSNTEQGRLEQEKGAMDIFDKVRYYSLKFSAEERRQVPDAIVRNFASGLGFQSLNQLFEYMDRTVAEADEKNREVARRGEFKLESGDLIKAVETEFLGKLLQNGVVCKEFLNGEQDSDATPLDADLGVVPSGMSSSISEAVQHKNDNNLFPAMHCMLVMKGDDNNGGIGRFKFESEGGEYDPWKYQIWKNSGENYGIRVGFPSTEIDYIIYDRIGSSNGDKNGDLERMKFELARNGLYIPVVDRYTEKVIFTPDEFDRMREEVIGGLKEYGDIPYRFADERGVVDGLSLPGFSVDETVIPSTEELVVGASKNREEVDEKREAIIKQIIEPVLVESGLTYENRISSNLFKGRAEVIDTGSTGRYSNAPHDGDFDFMMKLDKDIKDGTRLSEIREALLDRMNLTSEQRATAVQGENIRATDVKIDGLDELVDIDVTFARRTAKVDYSTDMALKEYYEAMREQSPEKAAEVVANVVYAKKFLKAYGAYKPSRKDSNQGGLGGVGVENWVIQNGGSFEAAVRSFMKVADECGDDFELFMEKYSVFDCGENHKMDAKVAHDNFVVGNMNKIGYGKMKVAFGEFLEMLDSRT